MDTQSFLFDFARSPTLFDQWNISFKLSDMVDTGNSNANFELVFCDDSPNNIRECLNSGGGIDESAVHTVDEVGCDLKWENNTLSIRNDVTWNIGDREVSLKAIFLRDATSQYVLSYCINISEFIVTNQLIFDGGIALWRIYDE